MNDADNEAQWLHQARQGSTQAFEQLVFLYQGRVRGQIARWIDDPNLVDDTAQEVFIIAWRQLAEQNMPGAFASWLTSIARHRAIDALRVICRERKRRGDAVVAQLHALRLHALEEQEAEAPADELAALHRCLQGLTPKQHQLIDEHYVQGLTCADMAARRRLGAGGLRMSLLRLRKALRTCIEQRVAVEVGR